LASNPATLGGSIAAGGDAMSGDIRELFTTGYGHMRCEACGADAAADDAEIERMKALITELCDALDEIGHVTQAKLPTEYWQKRKRLIEHARKVT
jgi:hypothetical protein